MFKSSKFSCLFIPLCLSVAFAHDYQYEQLSRQGIELAYKMEFDKASEIFSEAIELAPDNPLGYLLQSVNFYYRYQLEEHHKDFEKKFEKSSAQTIEISRRKLSDKTQRLDALFYLGTTYMYLAAYNGWENNWLKAYWYGKKGIDYLEKVVEINPEYYDAYLGLGIYHYYTDIIPKYVKPITFLLGIKPDRERGLQELRMAAERGIYSKIEAMLFLGSIYMYVEKDYARSLSYFQTLTDIYPENSSFLMLLGENYQKVGEHDLALETLNKLVNTPRAARFPVIIISSYFRLGNLYYNLQNYDLAIENYLRSLQHASQSSGNVSWVFALANLNLGRSYDMLGKRQQAVYYYKKVKKTDHKYAYEIAQQQIQEPLTLKHKSSLSKNYDEIIEIYQNALAKADTNNGGTGNRDMTEVNYYIAKALYDRGAYHSAMLKFQKIIATPEVEKAWLKPWSHYYLGNCHMLTGNIEKAAGEYETAYQFDDVSLRSEIDKIKTVINDATQK